MGVRVLNGSGTGKLLGRTVTGRCSEAVAALREAVTVCHSYCEGTERRNGKSCRLEG